MLSRWTSRFRRTGESRGPPRTAPASGSNQAPSTRQQTQASNHASGSNLPSPETPRIVNLDAYLRTPAPRRWNAAIKPRSRAFRDVVETFQEQLTESSIEEILQEYFTRHERDLLIPADRRRNRALARIQRLNRVRCRMLLQSQRFSTWAGIADSLELKLAMLWYGLPVAPIEFDPEEEFETGSDTDDDVARAETEKRAAAADRKKNSLRFLNSYGQRHFGRDHVRVPDPVYEAYYTFNNLHPIALNKQQKQEDTYREAMSLRGGGLSDESVDLNSDDFRPVSNDADKDLDSLSDYVSDHDAKIDDGSLRGGAATISGDLMAKALEIGEQLYKPKSKPAVHFEEQSTSEEETPRTPTTPSAKARGKQPARDDAPSNSRMSATFNERVASNLLPQTQEQRQRASREATYARPPSVHTDNNLPQHAPSIEKILKFGSNNLPSISLGVLTPTEQRRLQEDHDNMRNILLDRSQKCPYAGCERVIPFSDEARMQRHLADVHVGDGCNFCDEVLYQNWTENQRRAHFLAKHSELFLRITDVRQDNGFRARARPHGQVDYDRESRWKHCARCGRDHRSLDARADREHHDSVCYPGSKFESDDWIVCPHCGVIHEKMVRHQCRESLVEEEWPYCAGCALPLGLFSDPYHARHISQCQGFSTVNAAYCPWCHCALNPDRIPIQNNLMHLRECPQRPDAEAQGPLDPETGKPWPFKPLLEEQKPEPDQEPPEACPLCNKSIMHLDAHMLLRHLKDDHADEYEPSLCYFCKLDFKKRGWADDRKKILLHLDDHIHDRKVRLAADMVLTLELPPHHPYRRHVLKVQDYAEIKDKRELEHAKQIHLNLWQAHTARQNEMTEDRRQIVLLREELRGLDRDLARAKAKNVEEGSKSTVASAAPVGEQKENGGKGKANAKPTTTSGTTATPKTRTLGPPLRALPPTAAKPKVPRPSTTAGGRADSPSESDGSGSLDSNFRTVWVNYKPVQKRKRTLNDDPSFRPGPEDEDSDEDEEMESDGGRRRKVKKSGGAGEAKSARFESMASASAVTPAAEPSAAAAPLRKRLTPRWDPSYRPAAESEDEEEIEEIVPVRK